VPLAIRSGPFAVMLCSLLLGLATVTGCGQTPDPPPATALPASWIAPPVHSAVAASPDGTAVVPFRTPASTLVPSPPPNSAVNPKDALETQTANDDQETRTVVALTPTAFPMGIFYPCDSATGELFSSCWHGLVNDRLLGVYSGLDGQLGTENRQAFVRVVTFDSRRQITQTKDYPLPVLLSSPAAIWFVGGPYVTLTADEEESYRFVFDLSTRQWQAPLILPRPTVVVGRVGCPEQANSHQAEYSSCRQTVINGEVVTLDAGRDGLLEWVGDYSTAHGRLLLLVAQVENKVRSWEIYKPPLDVTSLAIVTVEGSRATFIADYGKIKGVILTFDLVTRQWINPGPVPKVKWAVKMEDCGYKPGIISCWSRRAQRKDLFLFAGSDNEDSGLAKGVLIISPTADRPSEYSPANEEYFSPHQVGPIRITGLIGSRVTLTTIDAQYPQTTFVFDLDTRRWLGP